LRWELSEDVLVLIKAAMIFFSKTCSAGPAACRWAPWSASLYRSNQTVALVLGNGGRWGKLRKKSREKSAFSLYSAGDWARLNDRMARSFRGKIVLFWGLKSTLGRPCRSEKPKAPSDIRRLRLVDACFERRKAPSAIPTYAILKLTIRQLPPGSCRSAWPGTWPCRRV